MLNKREHWSNSLGLGFVFAAASSAIGLGNIWKFAMVQAILPMCI